MTQAHPNPSGKSRPQRRIHSAQSKAEIVKDELKLAAAKLHLANTALEYTLPASEKKGDVKKAMEENKVVEQKVKESAKELAHVAELLAEEAQERDSENKGE